MTKANVKATAQVSEFVGKSAKEVRQIGLAHPELRASALAYASRKQVELASHKFRGQLWAQTVSALSGVAAPKAKAAPAKLTQAEILAQIQALTAQLAK